MEEQQEKRPVGRPPLKMPEPIDDATPEEVRDVLMNTPPPKFTYEGRAGGRWLEGFILPPFLRMHSG